jgi:hypothetical protein
VNFSGRLVLAERPGQDRARLHDHEREAWARRDLPALGAPHDDVVGVAHNCGVVPSAISCQAYIDVRREARSSLSKVTRTFALWWLVAAKPPLGCPNVLRKAARLRTGGAAGP